MCVTRDCTMPRNVLLKSPWQTADLDNITRVAIPQKQRMLFDDPRPYLFFFLGSSVLLCC